MNIAKLKQNKLIDYIITSQKELKKVTWPTKKDTTKYSLIVIGLSVFVAAFFGILDFFFSQILNLIISKFV